MYVIMCSSVCTLFVNAHAVCIVFFKPIEGLLYRIEEPGEAAHGAHPGVWFEILQSLRLHMAPTSQGGFWFEGVNLHSMD